MIAEDIASDSAVPYPFPLTKNHVYSLPISVVTGRGRRVLEPCELCGEKYYIEFQMWQSNWLYDVHDDKIYYRCWFCWDGADNEVREHAFQAKLRGLSRTTQAQSALLRLLMCPSVFIWSTVTHFCMDFSWRSWRSVRFVYADGRRSWIYQARITYMSTQDAKYLATPGHLSDGTTEEQRKKLFWSSRKYMATHINHNVLQKQGYFKHWLLS